MSAILELRRGLGLSQQQMAENLQVSIRGYQNYEQGKRTAPFDMLALLSDVAARANMPEISTRLNAEARKASRWFATRS